MEKQFDEYKAELARRDTNKERKEKLIALMQENLKERCEHYNGSIVCLDGQEHSLDSENVEDLYAIDGFLRSDEKRTQQSVTGNIKRQQAQSVNKYGPDNPYPYK